MVRQMENFKMTSLFLGWEVKRLLQPLAARNGKEREYILEKQDLSLAYWVSHTVIPEEDIHEEAS